MGHKAHPLTLPHDRLPPIDTFFALAPLGEAPHSSYTSHPALPLPHLSFNGTLRPLFSNGSLSHQSSSPLISRLPSRLPPIHPNDRFNSCHLSTPQQTFPYHSWDLSTGSGRQVSTTTLLPQHVPRPNAIETTNNLAAFDPVSSVTLASFPRPQHPPLFNLEGHSPFTTIDYLSSRVRNLQLDQAFGPPPIPPRPRQPTLAYDGPFTLDLSYGSPPSPSLLLSPSIDGSPLTEPQQLPFPLIPQPFNQPASKGPLPETRAVRSKGRGSKGRSDRAPPVPRVERRITRNGKPYSRDRPDDLMPRPGQRLLTRRSWTLDEHDIASRALEWYEAENPTFVVSKSTMEEQHVAFPMIFLHIVEQHPDWRRGYEGLLTWATKTKGRPTTRKRAGRGRWIASKPVVRKRKAKSLPTTRKRPTTKA